jgi:DnaJ-domain-containing protein 1
MIIQRRSEGDIRPDQVRAMAHGLHHLAAVDGIAERERELIREFLKDGGVDLDVESLAKIPFSLDELLYSLDTVFLRKTFLKVCVLMARADGTVTDEELAELRRISQAMGIHEPLDDLVSELEGKSID